MSGLARRDLSADEARRLVNQVSYSLGQAWRQLTELHERRGWLALGYTSFEELVVTEFDVSRRQAHRLVAHGQTVHALEGAVSPDMPDRVTRGSHEGANRKKRNTESDVDLSHLTERQTRELKPVLDDVVAEIRTRVAALDSPTDEGRRRVVNEVVDEFRQQVRSSDGATQARRESTTPTAREPARSATAREYLDQQPTVQRAKYATAFTGAVARAARMFSEFDPDQVADTLGGDATTMGTVGALRLAADDWFARLAQARKPDLRVLAGGDQS